MRRRLVVLAAAVTSAVVIAFVVPLGLLVQDLARDRAISSAQRDAQALASTLAALQPLDRAVALAVLGATPPTEGRRLSVVLADGDVVGPRADQDVVSQARSRRVIVIGEVDGGEAVAVPIVGELGTAAVYAFVSYDALTRNVPFAWMILTALGFFAIGLSVALADRLGRSIVDPVVSLADAARAWARGDLAVRVRPDGPDEVADSGRAFNQLADRFGEVLREERESVADLSHRLRTPLTALQLDIDAVEDDEARRRLAEDVDDLRRTVDFVIAQARRPVREGAGAESDLASIVRERASFWEVLADEQGRTWEVTVPPIPVAVPGVSDDLEAVIDALIANVFSHTDEGVACRVVVTADGALVVEDEGEGFTEDMLERGRSEGGSTGLGLDIVRRAAEAHGGAVRIDLLDPGVRVTVRFRA